MKCQLIVKARFHKIVPSLSRELAEVRHKTTAYFCSTFHAISSPAGIQRCYRRIVIEIFRNQDNFTGVGSGWSLRIICFADIFLLRLSNNAFGGAGSPTVSLPTSLKSRRCIYDVKDCPDNSCFAYSIAAAVLQLKCPGQQRPAYTQFVNSLQCIRYPMPMSDVHLFEKANNIAVNVFTWCEDQRCLKVLHHSILKRNKKVTQHVCNLLLHENHFFVIRSLNPLFSIRKGKHVFVCQKCYVSFPKKQVMWDIANSAGKKIKQCLHTPPPNTYLKFENYKRTIKNPIIYFADLETMACHYNVKKGEKTLLRKKHIPVSFGIMRIAENPKYSTKPFVYHGRNVIKRFIAYLEEEYALLQTLISEINHPISMTEQSRDIFRQSTHCALCGLKFSKQTLKMRDHNHLLAKNNFRFALCNSCNLNRACLQLVDIPVCFHNLSGFDSHAILADLHEANSSLGKIRVIPHNTEKNMSFSLGPFKFIDTLKFLPASLKVLVRNLKEKDTDAFVNTRKLCDDTDTFVLIAKKQPYPYSYAMILADYHYAGLLDKIHFPDELRGGKTLAKMITDTHNWFTNNSVAKRF